MTRPGGSVQGGGDSSGAPHKIGAWAIPLGLAVLASGWMFVATRHQGLLGFDSYPIVLTSRVQSIGDLVGDFSQRLMHGRYPGDFYRPLLSLSFALDYALWGLNPTGYQLTGALLFGAGGLMVFLLARRLLGGEAILGPLVAMLIFFLHPTHIEVIPAPPRRPELLCWLFMALALWLQAHPRALKPGKVPVLPAVAGLLAMATKETGLLLPCFAFFVVAFCSEQPALVARLRQAGVALVPHAIALSVMLAARFAVLGGVGGHRVSGLEGSADRLPSSLLAVWAFLVAPQPAGPPGVVGGPSVGVWSGVLGLGAALASVWLAFRRGPDGAARPPLPRAVRTALLAIVWLLVLGTAYAAAGGIQAWYLFLPVAGFSLLLGALADLARLAMRSAGWLPRAAAVLLLGAVSALGIWQARYSPFFHRYVAWDRATRVSETFFGELASRVEAAPDAAAIPCPAIPRWVPVQPGLPSVRGAAILADYSVQAWLELRFPSRKIRVTRSAAERPGPDELLVVAGSLLPGYESASP